jgi:hypothetical protein
LEKKKKKQDMGAGVAQEHPPKLYPVQKPTSSIQRESFFAEKRKRGDALLSQERRPPPPPPDSLQKEMNRVG